MNPARIVRYCALVLALGCGSFLGAAEALAESRKVVFLHVNDVYEFLPGDRRGGLAALKTLIREEQSRDPQALVTFGGDLISPSAASSVTQGSHLIDFFNRLDLTAATLGNHEFDFGPEILRRRMQDSRFPWLVANVFEADGRPFGGASALRLVDANGVKVGLFGLLTAETANLSAAGGGVVFRPEAEAARQAVALLREKGADIVVALTHQDLDADRKLLRDIGGIDLVLGGHDHNAIVLEEDGLLIVKAGENATHLAVVELEVEVQVDANGRKTVRASPANWRFLATKGIVADEELAQLAAMYDAKLNGALEQPLVRLGAPLDSREEMVRSRETAIGNLVADAMRNALRADIALINGGSIRGNRTYEKEALLSRADILREFPFRNAAVLIDVTGRDLQAALEAGVSKAPAKAGRFPQVSGMSFSYNPAAEPGKRIRKLLIGGKPVIADAHYRLATNSYLADGKDGYAVLKGRRKLVDSASAPLLTTLLIDYLAGQEKVTATVEGRISENPSP